MVKKLITKAEKREARRQELLAYYTDSFDEEIPSKQRQIVDQVNLMLDLERAESYP